MSDNFNFIDFYIGYPGHPSFKNAEIIDEKNNDCSDVKLGCTVHLEVDEKD